MLTNDQSMRGILYALLSVFLFTLMSVIGKILSETYPITQVIFFRCFIGLLVAVVMAVTDDSGLRCLVTKRPMGHVLRSLAGFASMVGWFVSFQLLPVAEAQAIGYAGPLFLTILAVFFLGEVIRIRRWLAICVGFIGVMIVIQPDPALYMQGDTAAVGALFGLFGALMYGIAMVFVRKLSETENTRSIVFYFSVTATLLSAIPLFWGWRTPFGVIDWGLFILMGVVAGAGQQLMTQAFRLIPAGLASSFNYSSIVWATLFGYLIWQDFPPLDKWLGIALVILSGLYIIYREVVRKRERELQKQAA